MLPAVNDSNYDAPNNRAAATQEREEILDRIAASVSSAGMNPVRDDAVVKTISSFSKALADSNQNLLETLVEDDKQLLKDTIKEFSNLQAKTSKEFADKLDKALKFAERLILRGESENKPELANVGGKLKEDLLREKFKALGIDDDPTLGQRVKRRLVGKVDVDADSNKVSGWVQGKSILKNAAKDFAGGFSSGFMGGRFEGVSKTNEERRNEVRAQAERENKQLAFVEESQRNLNAVLDQSGDKDQITKGGGEETTQLSSANISPDTKTKSDVEELKAGIRDTDKAFSRSSTILGEQNYWPQLLKLLEDIKKCVCECQCSGGGPDLLPDLLPVPTRSRVPTRVPTRVAERVAIPTRVSVPALEATKVSRPLALPAPAAVEAQGLARQVAQARPAAAPALEYKPLNNTPLNFETQRVREKVPVRGTAEEIPTSRTPTGRTVAEQKVFQQYEGKTAPEIREMRRAKAAPAPKVEPEVAAARERARDSYRPGETTEQWKERRAANAKEDELVRKLKEQEVNDRWNRAKNGPAPIPETEPLPANRAPVPVTGTAEPAPKPSMWERVKTGAGRAWEGTKNAARGGWEKIKTGTSKAWEATKSGTSRAWEATKGFGSRAWGKVTGAAERVGNWSANTRVGRAVVGATESPFARKISSVAGKVANSGVVKWGGRLLGAAAAGLDVYNRRKEGQSWGKVGAGVGSGLAGAALGAKGGAALGGAIGTAFFGVGAVPGAAIGGFLGGVGGYIAGSGAGDWLYDKVMGSAEPTRNNSAPRPAVATRAGARQAPAASIQQRPRAAVQSGQNQDSAMIARSSAAVATARGVAERPVINVPPPTVIQAPANNAPSTIPHTRPHSRPEDNSWLTWQRRRTAVMA